MLRHQHKQSQHFLLPRRNNGENRINSLHSLRERQMPESTSGTKSMTNTIDGHQSAATKKEQVPPASMADLAHPTRPAVPKKP